MAAIQNDMNFRLSYELRSPLTSLRSLSEILHDNPDMDEKKRREFIGIILQQAERLNRAITHLLEDGNGVSQNHSI